MTTEMKLVPVEPTEEMIRAATENNTDRLPNMYTAIYRAMLSAAPAPWQPIETAPKTGFFMAWSPDFPEIPSVWKGEIFHTARAQGTPKHLASLHWTHWQPLPAPPADGGGHEG